MIDLTRAALLSVVVALCGCKPAEIPVTGEVFVVTKAGSSIKLGLVTISVYDAETALSNLATYQQKNKAEFDARYAKAMAAMEEYKRLGNEYENARAAVDALSPTYVTKSGEFAISRKWDEASKKAQDAAGRHGDALRAAGPLLEAAAEMNSNDRLLAELGDPIASAKTNADGRFEFILTAGRKYLFAAKKVRELDPPESFYWVVQEAPQKKGLHLMLTSENTVGSSAVDSGFNYTAWQQFEPIVAAKNETGP